MLLCLSLILFNQDKQMNEVKNLFRFIAVEVIIYPSSVIMNKLSDTGGGGG